MPRARRASLSDAASRPVNLHRHDGAEGRPAIEHPHAGDLGQALAGVGGQGARPGGGGLGIPTSSAYAAAAPNPATSA